MTLSFKNQFFLCVNLKMKKDDTVFKVHLEKVHDHVNLDFLEFCLNQNMFPPIIIMLIMHCVTCSSMSILWNGRQLPNLVPNRGLGQDDPISPYIFIICI